MAEFWRLIPAVRDDPPPVSEVVVTKEPPFAPLLEAWLFAGGVTTDFVLFCDTFACSGSPPPSGRLELLDDAITLILPRGDRNAPAGEPAGLVDPPAVLVAETGRGVACRVSLDPLELAS